MIFVFVFVLFYKGLYTYSYDEALLKDDTIYIIYYNNSIENELTLDFSDTNKIDLIPFNTSCNTKIFIHGLKDNVDAQSVTQGVKAYMGKKQCLNIMAISWYYHVSNYDSYFNKFIVLEKAHPILFEKLKYLIDKKKIFLNTMHLLGHSLGCRLAGMIGDKFNGQISRITGLDPDGFFLDEIKYQLIKTHAKFVEIIHSNPYNLGTKRLLGHTDVFISNGSPPSCSNPGLFNFGKCEHSLSYSLYYKSLLEPFLYPLNKCNSMKSMDLHKCRNKKMAKNYLAEEVINKKMYLKNL